MSDAPGPAPTAARDDAPSPPDGSPADRAPAVAGGRWRRWLSPWNFFTLLIVVWALPRLLPHLGAVVGIRSGDARRPTFSATTLDGAVVSDSSLRGQVVLVNFWATWCGPCRVEMPLLEQMYQRHRGRGFVLLGLSVDRAGEAVVRQYVRSRGVTYPVAVVGAREEGAFGGVRGYPTSFLLGRDGTIRHAVIGPLAPASLELAVRRLLDEAVPNAR